MNDEINMCASNAKRTAQRYFSLTLFGSLSNLAHVGLSKAGARVVFALKVKREVLLYVKHHQILQRIIPRIAIYVMNVLMGFQLAPKMVRHNQAMLSLRSAARAGFLFIFRLSPPLRVNIKLNTQTLHVSPDGTLTATQKFSDFVRREILIFLFHPFAIVQLLWSWLTTRWSRSFNSVPFHGEIHRSMTATQFRSDLLGGFGLPSLLQPISIVKFWKFCDHNRQHITCN